MLLVTCPLVVPCGATMRHIGDLFLVQCLGKLLEALGTFSPGHLNECQLAGYLDINTRDCED